MAEGTRGNGGQGDDPYSFDAGKSFFADDGTAGENERDDGEIRVIEPTEAFGTGTRTSEGNTGSIGSDATSAAQGGNAAAGAAGATGKRKYTRRAKTNEAVHLGGWEDAIQAIHLGIAALAHAPEMELDDEEAKKVTLALDRLAGHYNVQPTETQKVWMQFFGAMSAVYGSRAVAIYKRVTKDQKKDGNVLRPTFPGA
jgi:hypothetical protein